MSSASTMVVLDLETLGTNDDSVVIDASFLVYDIIRDKDKSLVELYNSDQIARFKLSVADQKRLGRIIEPETVEWWKNQSKEARMMCLPSDDDLTISQFHSALTEFLKRNNYDNWMGWAWQRGTVDIMWLDSLWNSIGVKQNERPIKWSKVRDLRTAIDLLGTSSKMNGYQDGWEEEMQKQFPEFIHHNSKHDLLKEVLMLRMAGVF